LSSTIHKEFWGCNGKVSEKKMPKSETHIFSEEISSNPIAKGAKYDTNHRPQTQTLSDQEITMIKAKFPIDFSTDQVPFSKFALKDRKYYIDDDICYSDSDTTKYGRIVKIVSLNCEVFVKLQRFEFQDSIHSQFIIKKQFELKGNTSIRQFDWIKARYVQYSVHFVHDCIIFLKMPNTADPTPAKACVVSPGKGLVCDHTNPLWILNPFFFSHNLSSVLNNIELVDG